MPDCTTIITRFVDGVPHESFVDTLPIPPAPHFPLGVSHDGATVYVGAEFPAGPRRVEVRVRKPGQGDAEYANRSRPVDGDYSTNVGGLEPETTYIVDARYFSHADTPSPWSPAATLTTAAAPPPESEA